MKTHIVTRAWVVLPFLFFFKAENIPVHDPNVYAGKNGKVHFESDAQLETIQAASAKLVGALNISDHTFYFTVPIISFEGFNSALQREHFNENYLESEKYPDGTFKGRILDAIDFSKTGVYTVRAKGVLTIHGIGVERIIEGKLAVSASQITLSSQFVIPLEDHNITTPKIVELKIAEVVNVDVQIVLTRNF